MSNNWTVRVVGLVVAASAGIGLSACASGPSSRGTGNDQRMAAAAATTESFSGPSASQLTGDPFAPVNSDSLIDYGTGLVSTPAAAPDKASIPEQEAITTAGQLTLGDVGGSPEVALRNVSYDPVRGSALPSGVSDDSKVANVLAWMIVYRNTAPQVRGPGSLTSTERDRFAKSLTCVWVVAIDARTGAPIVNEQICRRAG